MLPGGENPPRRLTDVEFVENWRCDSGGVCSYQIYAKCFSVCIWKVSVSSCWSARISWEFREDALVPWRDPCYQKSWIQNAVICEVFLRMYAKCFSFYVLERLNFMRISRGSVGSLERSLVSKESDTEYWHITTYCAVLPWKQNLRDSVDKDGWARA